MGGQARPMDAVKQRRTLVEETYEILLAAICSGELPPGERLNQDEIAAKLNVSRQPVNSAISILKTNGLVEDTGRRRVVVTRFDPALFQSIYEYRKVIEPFAVRLAGKNLAALDQHLASKVVQSGQQAAQTGKLSDLIQADMMFHETIYEWSGNHAIITSMRTNWHHIRRSMAEVLRAPDAVMPVWEEHAGIMDALFDGDTEAAARAMEDHIDHAYRAIAEGISQNRL